MTTEIKPLIDYLRPLEDAVERGTEVGVEYALDADELDERVVDHGP